MHSAVVSKVVSFHFFCYLVKIKDLKNDILLLHFTKEIHNIVRSTIPMYNTWNIVAIELLQTVNIL